MPSAPSDQSLRNVLEDIDRRRSISKPYRVDWNTPPTSLYNICIENAFCADFWASVEGGQYDWMVVWMAVATLFYYLARSSYLAFYLLTPAPYEDAAFTYSVLSVEDQTRLMRGITSIMNQCMYRLLPSSNAFHVEHVLALQCAIRLCAQPCSHLRDSWMGCAWHWNRFRACIGQTVRVQAGCVLHI